MQNTSYNRIIRKLVIGFGNLFNNITLVKYNKDNTESQRVLVPITYATKELYVQRLEADPALDKKVQITLPTMSFDLESLAYDVTRKQNTNIKNFAKTNSGVISQYNPVPYNFDFNLYIYVRNVEDGTQIIEHIVPYFTPDYTIKLNLIPEMGIVRDVPIILNSVTNEVDYEGSARSAETRMIIWTLNFTVKGFIFGKTTDVGLINHSITNILSNVTSTDTITFDMDEINGLGNYQVGELVYQGYSAPLATATAKVVSWNGEKLELTNINGNFISNLPIIGIQSNATYPFISTSLLNQTLVKIDVLPTPPDANGAEPWTANTIIQEYPQVFTPVVPAEIVPEIIDLNNSGGIYDLENDLGLK